MDTASKNESAGFFFFVCVCNFICLFFGCAGLHCSTGFSLVEASGGLYLAVVCRLLIAVAFCCRACTLGRAGYSSWGCQALEHRFSSCGAQAYLLHGMWDLPRKGVEPMSPTLAGRFFITEAPGKP